MLLSLSLLPLICPNTTKSCEAAWQYKNIFLAKTFGVKQIKRREKKNYPWRKKRLYILGVILSARLNMHNHAARQRVKLL